jgi:hypothetical protein
MMNWKVYEWKNRERIHLEVLISNPGPPALEARMLNTTSQYPVQLVLAYASDLPSTTSMKT